MVKQSINVFQDHLVWNDRLLFLSHILCLRLGLETNNSSKVIWLLIKYSTHLFCPFLWTLTPTMLLDHGVPFFTDALLMVSILIFILWMPVSSNARYFVLHDVFSIQMIFSSPLPYPFRGWWLYSTVVVVNA